MSRTKRRTGNVEKPYWLEKPCKHWKRINGKWEYIELTEKEIKVDLNKFHSDVGLGWMDNAPKWYRQELEAIRRAKAKSEIRRVWREGDYENYNFEPIRKDANWNWW